MSQTEIITAAMLLSDKERADVIVELLESLDNNQKEISDGALLLEAEQREAMMDADPATEITHEALLSRFTHLRRK
jgi:Putative addiction module component